MLVITGSMGAGKTTVMAEASDLLAHRGFVHAALDFDALAVAHLPANANQTELTCENLRRIWHNYEASDVNALLLAAAVESRAELERLRALVEPHDVVVCRLRAPIGTMQERIRIREPGMLQEQFVRRVAELDATLDVAAVEDFSLLNDGVSVTEVAREMLVRAGWLLDQ
jgi:adenylylsulfate kinase